MQQSFIITDELFNGNTDHKKLYDKVVSIAERRGSVFIPIKLLCDPEIIVDRYTCLDRSHEFKNTNKTSALINCTENVLIEVRHQNLITLDITELTAKESALEIVHKIETLLE